jgi:hypothetical protein
LPSTRKVKASGAEATSLERTSSPAVALGTGHVGIGSIERLMAILLEHLLVCAGKVASVPVKAEPSNVPATAGGYREDFAVVVGAIVALGGYLGRWPLFLVAHQFTEL